MKTDKVLTTSDSFRFPFFNAGNKESVGRDSGLDYACLSQPGYDLLDGYFDSLDLGAQRARLRAAREERNSPALSAARLTPRPSCASSSDAGEMAFLIGEGTNTSDPQFFLNSLIPHYFRAAVSMETQEPRSLACDLNDIVCSGRTAKSAVTCFYAHYTRSSKILRYFNAGHRAPLLIRSKPDQVLRLNAGGPAFGAELTPRYSQGALQLQTGDRLVAFTQGVVKSWTTGDGITAEATLIGMLKDGMNQSSAKIADSMVHAAPVAAGPRQLDRIAIVASVEN